MGKKDAFGRGRRKNARTSGSGRNGGEGSAARSAASVAPAEPEKPIALDVEGLALGGAGVGRLPAEDSAASSAGGAGRGMAVFVRGALPGSRVRARVTRRRKRYAEAELLEVLTPSPDAVAPACPHFSPVGESCGGCLLQHLAPERQLAWKERQMLEALSRIGRVEPEAVLPAVPASRTAGFRNKMEFAFQGAGAGLRLGLRRRDDPSRVLDVRSCIVLPPEGMDILAAVRSGCRAAGLVAFDRRSGAGYLRRLVLRRSAFQDRWLAQVLTAADSSGERVRALRALGAELLGRFPRLAGFVHAERTARDDLAQAERTLSVQGEAALTESLGGVRYRVSADAFFQTAAEGALALYSALLDMAAPQTTEVCCDLYCGCGGITLFAAGSCARAFGLEANPAAVADAEANARLNGVENCRFLRADLSGERPLEDVFPAECARPDVVTADPPREGLSAGVVAWLSRVRPSRTVYVSCNPATLARDAGLLSPAFRLRAVRAVDMFPHTAHVECLALFVPR